MDWNDLLVRRPEFKSRFNPSWCTNSFDWEYVLMGCPSLWRKCPFERADQIACAIHSLPLLKKIGVSSLTQKDWDMLLDRLFCGGTPVKKWLSGELKRLSKSLRL